MLTLTSYQGVVQNGVIRLRDVRLPEGAQVVVVVAETQTLSVDEPLQRWQARPLDDRQRRFDELADHVSQHQAEVDIDTRPARLRRQAADKVCTHSHSAPLRGLACVSAARCRTIIFLQHTLHQHKGTVHSRLAVLIHRRHNDDIHQARGVLNGEKGETFAVGGRCRVASNPPIFTR